MREDYLNSDKNTTSKDKEFENYVKSLSKNKIKKIFSEFSRSEKVFNNFNIS